MAKRKKTVAQRAVGLAAPVMPAPVAKVVGTRWGARLFLLLLPFLLATGIITISWTNGLPMVSFRDAMWPEFSAGRLAWRDYYADEVHPNDAGHEVAAAFLRRLLAEHLDTPDSAAAAATS